MRLSLRNRFLLPVVALIVLGMGIASAILLTQSRQAARDLRRVKGIKFCDRLPIKQTGLPMRVK
jgi:hypothetical protein